MGARIDVFVNKDLCDEVKWGAKLSAIIIAISLLPLIIVAIVRRDWIFLIGTSCFLLLCEMLCVFASVRAPKNWLKKVLLTESYIQLQSFQGELLNEVSIKDIKQIKKIMVQVPRLGRFKKLLECIVLYVGNEELEENPEYRLYLKDQNFIFIENRPGLEELLKRYLPQVEVIEKD